MTVSPRVLIALLCVSCAELEPTHPAHLPESPVDPGEVTAVESSAAPGDVGPTLHDADASPSAAADPELAIEGEPLAPPPRPPAPATLEAVTAVAGAAFGGSVQGFARWASASGRFVILSRFAADTNGDGEITIRFGHHGEPLADSPRVFVYDRVAGTETAYDELLTSDGRGRYVALRRGGEIWLLDDANGERQELTRQGASAEGDANPCLSGRQVEIETRGRRLAYPAADPDRLVVRELPGGEERSFLAHGRLWRGEPTARAGWAILREIPADTDGDGAVDFPQQRTSCACRWCGRFAMSWGFYGWGGDAFVSHLVGPRGERVEIPGAAVALGQGLWLDPSSAQLHYVDGDVIAPPEGCAELTAFSGAAGLLMRCGEESRILWPSSGREKALGGIVSAADGNVLFSDTSGADWAAVAVAETPDGPQRLGRLRLTDGYLERGPAIDRLGSVDRAGWVHGRAGGDRVALHLTDGAVLRAPGIDGDGVGPVVKVADDRWVVIAPAAGRSYATGKEPYLLTATGCTVEANAGQGELETGPWRLRCP